MGKISSLIGGLGVGAAAMYFWDPQKGTARRALVRDKANSVLKAKLEAKETMVRDARNRLQGIAAVTMRKLRRVTPEDEKLVEQIRSKMGHVISHPGAIDIGSAHGVVRIKGAILAAEVEPLMECVWTVDGVQSIEHQLDIHESAEHIPALQGERRTMAQDHEEWTPAASLALGVAGGLLAIYGIAKRGVVGTTLSAVGISVLAKSLKDTEGARIMQRAGGDSGWR
jgi:hypothetical protein